MIQASLKLYVDWDSDGDYSETWEDIAAYVVSLQYDRGRDYANNAAGRSIAGAATVTVTNFDGRFSAWNQLSALYGYLEGGKRLQIELDGTAEWTGYIDTINPISNISGYGTVEIKALGPLSQAKGKKINIALQENIRTGDAVDLILDYIGIGTGDRTIDTGQNIIDYYLPAPNQDALRALRELELSECGFIVEAKDGKWAFEDRHHRLAGSNHQYTQVVFADDNSTGSLGYNRIEQGDRLKGIANIIRADVVRKYEGAVTVIWTLAESGEFSPAIAPSASKEIWVNIPIELGGVDLAGVSSWTTPVATTDYLANTVATGSGTDITSDIAVTADKFTGAMKLTLTNNNAATAYITFLQARGIPLYADDKVIVRSEDATSKTKYGEQELDPATLLPDITEGDRYCDYQLEKFKDPHPTITLEYMGNASATYLAEAEVRDIGDLIYIHAVNNAKLGVSGNFFVERINRSINFRTNTDRVKYVCSKALDVSWNEISRSEQMDQSPWVDYNEYVEIDPNVVGIICPDGTETADKIQAQQITPGGGYVIWNGYGSLPSLTSGTNCIWSAFFKPAENTQIQILLDHTSKAYYAIFNVDTGAIVGSSNCSPYIYKFPSGWYRCVISLALTTTGTHYPYLGVICDDTSEHAGAYAWGAQFQSGITLIMEYVKTVATADTAALFWILGTSVLGTSTLLSVEW